MVLLLALAFALRVPLLNGPRFHPDEALFASFARSIAVWRDPLLAAAPVDKPPLLFYLQALCYPFQGPKEMAARLPNLFASQITVALVFAATRGLAAWPRSLPTDSDLRARFDSMAAAGLFALSPLAIAFGSTAFTDPLMVMWGMAAVAAAVRGRPGWVGLWLGLGLASKYQAVFFAPLAAGVLWLAMGSSWRVWRRLLAGLAPPVTAVALWDWVRTGRFTLVSAQMKAYGGLRLLELDELGPRLREWGGLARYITGSPMLDILLWVALAGLLLWMLVWRPKLRPLAPILLLLAWLLNYFLWHWLLDIHVWDRYLLPAVPVLAVAVGLVINGTRRLALQYNLGPVQDTQAKTYLLLRIVAPFLICVVLASMLPNAGRAAGGELPIGGDHGQADGIEQVAEFLEPYPYGTVLYDHWLSWRLRYYLFDSRVYVSWFAEPAALVDNLQVFGTHPAKFLLMPTWESFSPIARALETADFNVEPAFKARRPDGSVSLVVYRIIE